MESSQQLAARFREVILNGTWIANTNYFDQLSNTNVWQATAKVGPLNTIAALTQHINYYLAGVLRVLKGGPLDIRDKYSFDFPELESEGDWQSRLQNLWDNTMAFCDAVEQLTENELNAVFVDAKYGTCRRNIEALIEHSYYHLGQIVLIRRMQNL